MNIFVSVVFIALLFCIVAGVIKKYAPEFLSPMLAAFGAACLATAAPHINEVISSASGITFISENEDIEILVKVVAINIVASSATDICEDSGIKTAGGFIMLAAEIFPLLAAMPIFRKLITIIGGLLK